MKWVEALKKYNEGKKWSVPKKGTPEYEAVRKLMGADGAKAEAPAPAPAPAEAPKAKRVYKKRPPKQTQKDKEDEKLAMEVKEVKEKVAPEKKKRAVRKGKAVVVKDVDDSTAVEARPKVGKAKAKAGSVPAGLGAQGATVLAVEKSKNPEAVLESATNAHMPVVSAENFVGLKPVHTQKAHLREVLKPSLPALVDTEKVVNAPPFSFQQLRNHLGC